MVIGVTAGWRLLRFYYGSTSNVHSLLTKVSGPGHPRRMTPRGPGDLDTEGVVVEVEGSAVAPRPPPGLLPEGDVADHHRAVGRLAHVVDGERRDRARGHGFHLDAGAVDGVDLGL